MRIDSLWTGENLYQPFLDGGLISRICKELKKLDINEQTVQSMTGEMNMESSNGKIQADNTYMNLSLVTTDLSQQDPVSNIKSINQSSIHS